MYVLFVIHQELLSMQKMWAHAITFETDKNTVYTPFPQWSLLPNFQKKRGRRGLGSISILRGGC